MLQSSDTIGLSVEGLITAGTFIADLIPSNPGIEITDQDEILAVAAKFTELAASLPLVSGITFDVAAAEALLTDPCAALDIDICQNPFDASAVDLELINEIPDLITNLFNGATTFATNAVGKLNADLSSGINDVSKELASSIAIFNTSLSTVNDLTATTSSTLAGLQGFVNNSLSTVNTTLTGLNSLTSSTASTLAGLQGFVNDVDQAGINRLNATINQIDAALDFVCTQVNKPVDFIRGLSVGPVTFSRIQLFPTVHVDVRFIHEHVGPFFIGPFTLLNKLEPFKNLPNIPCPAAIPRF